MNDDGKIKSPPAAISGHKNLAEEILDTLWEPLLVLENDLCVQSANDAFYRHFQVEPAETVGRPVYHLGNGQWDIPLLRKLLEEILPREAHLSDFEIQHTFEQIGRRTLLLKARRIDHLELILLAMEDITKRQEIEACNKAVAVAEEASRAKSEFMANMGHEFRTPMTAFLVAMELLLQKDKDPERLEILTMADQSAQRLQTLLEGILDLSCIEAQGIKIEKEPFNLLSLVENTVQKVMGKVREKNLQLEIDISPEVPVSLIGDPDRLGQILFLLVDNAIKFSHQGEVRLSVRLCTDILEFSVSDTGIGIPEEQRGLIFQRFTQGDGSFTRKYGGTGLGLAIAKGLVELMEGRIGVRERQGGGSDFYFTLPLIAAVSPEVPSAGKWVEVTAAPLSTPRILVVEDEAVLRGLIQTIMKQQGWGSETAENGMEAVQKWKEGHFDLILMDLQMPKMNGLEATREIRKAEEGKPICILGLTAHTRREVETECLAAGMDQVLAKPMKMKELCSVIGSSLAGRNSQWH
jgi:signal transduction histidine kinase/ActR/RegA family two-component response regulator